MGIKPAQRPSIQLDDKYALEKGTAFMTGVQALVRLPIEQARRDRAAGLRTGTLISGYPGSPLGGYDLALGQARKHLQQLDIHHVPGVNEELAATTVWGSQMIDLFEHSRFDGVTGIWYGKSPGVDRCLDIFKHANLGGGPAHSGMLALAADDPQAKSSTLPNQSEWDFMACAMPVLYPASVQEFLEFGLHGIAMSRLTGLWTGFKAITNLCDGGAGVRVGPNVPEIVIPELKGFQKPNQFIFFAPGSIELERHLHEERFPAALAYVRANHLNRIIHKGRRDRIGIVAAGKTYADLHQALLDLGLSDAHLADIGVRVLKLGMIYPLEPGIVREFARGLEEIVVVEEKRDLVESQVRSILYSEADHPLVVGKLDQHGRGLFPYHGELDADLVAERVGPRLLRLEPPASVSRRLEEIATIRGREYADFARRMPNYCPGCPHSRSTVAVDGEVIGGGVGCHGMAIMMTQEERGAAYNAPMGAEGASWIGTSPFVDSDHLSQNVGDGTFFHSASQALRACVAAEVNITFKLLYNRHVSMTGGQNPEGSKDVATLTHYLKAEGVKQTIVVSEYPDSLRGADLAGNSVIRPRERYDDAVRELRQVAGVTVLLFDQQCAAEKRRARKRGKLPEPTRYVVINQEVCEGCGDCGDVSNCMSVQPVETEFGRKTQIHQSSCNKDYSCVRGDCPSFLTVYADKGLRRPTQAPAIEASAIPEPERRAGVDGAYRIYMPGIGGTGVVTINQVLAYAAMLEGREVHVLDQTGLAQKGGAVLSSLTILEAGSDAYISNKVGLGGADLVLGFDALGVVNPANADRLSPERTVVVADSTLQPTAEAIRHVDFLMPQKGRLQRSIDEFSRAGDNLWVEAEKTCEAIFADHMMANTFMVGAAYQAGLLPIGSESIEAAIRLNGVAVDKNLQAFRYGRLNQRDPARVRALLEEPVRDFAAERARYARMLGGDYTASMDRTTGMAEETRRLLAIRLGELTQFQDAGYAKRYLDTVLAVWERERTVIPGSEELTQVAARHLYKLMAYKDEYEVARLLIKGDSARRIHETFVDPRVKYNLHPPFLRSLGMKGKLELGAWFKPLLAALIPLRRLRGTALDVFGYAQVRRTERELIGWYRDLLDQVISGLTPENHRVALQVAAIPDRIRGYEGIKLANVKAARDYAARKVEELGRVRVGA